MTNINVGLLSPYRVLDISQGACGLSSKIFADLGADVIKIESPTGDISRFRGPFIDDKPEIEGSYEWQYLNANKRGITLDLDIDSHKELFKKLIIDCDFLFDSFEPGYLKSKDLSYLDLIKINPKLIMTSITPFGQDGPYVNFLGPDLVVWSLGGYMWMCGDPDRAPVRISITPQSYYHAAASAASAALISLYKRNQTGKGEFIDQSVQHTAPWFLTHTYQWYEYENVVLKREGGWRQFGTTRTRTLYPCKDGYVVFMSFGGRLGESVQQGVIGWMQKEGEIPDYLKDFDWSTFDALNTPENDREKIFGAIGEFLKTKTKSQLLEAAVRERYTMAPVNHLGDVVENPQLSSREFWHNQFNENLGRSLIFPGAPFLSSEFAMKYYRSAPTLGEHNEQILLNL
jgi:benzylsuccinate CoA-transferase BbsE subunit